MTNRQPSIPTSLLNPIAKALGVNSSAVQRLLEAFARGGIQGGAPDGDPPAPPAPASDPFAAVTAELEATKKELARHERAERQRADALFAELPAASQKKLEAFKDKLALGDWVGLLGAEKASTAAPVTDVTLPPATGSARPPSALPGDKHTPSAQAQQIMKKLMVNEETLRTLDVKANGNADSGGHPVFTIDDMRDFFGRMKRPDVRQVGLIAEGGRFDGGGGTSKKR